VNLDTARRSAERLGVTIEAFEVKDSAEVENALAAIAVSRPDAALLASDTLLLSQRKRITEVFAASRIPAIYPFKEYAESGGLFIYGANLSILFERAAGYLDKLLRSEKPGDLPVQQATAFELIVNLKTARELGLKLPPSVLVRADEVIE
jgi:putative tryptophan/tyrosine transport system substrate-binding protein